MTTFVVNSLFYIFSIILLLSAMVVVSARNPVYSVLFLILAFFNAAALFLLSGAEFIAMLLLIVYVGAVMVLFLFVVMMLNINLEQLRSLSTRYSFLAISFGLLILVELSSAIIGHDFSKSLSQKTVGDINITSNLSNTRILGDVLYTNYAVHFIIASLILFVAMIASIVLTLHHRENVKRQIIDEQVSRTKENAIEIKKVESGKGI